MCEASTIIAVAGLVLSAAGSAVSYTQQKSAANAQSRYQRQLQDAQNQSYLNEASSLREKQQQEAEAAGTEARRVQIDAQQALSRARTAAGESGVSGLGVQNLIGDFSRQEAQYLEHIHTQESLSDINTQQQLEADRLGTAYQMQATGQPIQRPSLFATALQIGKAGVDAYGTQKQLQAPDPNKTTYSTSFDSPLNRAFNSRGK